MGRYVDMLGQTVRIGDYIAYALVAGRSANQCIYKVVGFDDTKVRPVQVEPVARSYDNTYGKPKPFNTIGFLEERAVKLGYTPKVPK